MRFYDLQRGINFKNIKDLLNFQKFRALLDCSSFDGNVGLAAGLHLQLGEFLSESEFWPIHLSSTIKSFSFLD